MQKSSEKNLCYGEEEKALKTAITDFEKLADERENVASGGYRMFVSFSCYCAEDTRNRSI